MTFADPLLLAIGLVVAVALAWATVAAAARWVAACWARG